MHNKPFVAYLKNQSPTPQLNAHGHGWIELPNGQLWNPATKFKFNASSVARRSSTWCMARWIRGAK
ncbi:phage filamentation protein Fil family protein [Buttiauxella sp. A111]|uniref:phage filamentation protein Fil family protein n=1 Tax=Buttiauxella sp. A111 TaxID=2563088 RepID=UPI0010D8D755|nr:phage filamentation protein Fil family protein [Buttiauxella sp. A111]GDX05753.1 hypothetical protein BSPA111_19540 [Buttiauxella sp. A111]